VAVFFPRPNGENLAEYLNVLRNISTSRPNAWQRFQIRILNWSKSSKKILRHKSWYLATSGSSVKKHGFVIFLEPISISFSQKNIFRVIHYSIITSGKNANNFISKVASFESYLKSDSVQTIANLPQNVLFCHYSKNPHKSDKLRKNMKIYSRGNLTFPTFFSAWNCIWRFWTVSYTLKQITTVFVLNYEIYCPPPKLTFRYKIRRLAVISKSFQYPFHLRESFSRI
jgi:hypothetical protein